jgi:hypothetical protein
MKLDKMYAAAARNGGRDHTVGVASEIGLIRYSSITGAKVRRSSATYRAMACSKRKTPVTLPHVTIQDKEIPDG